LDLQCGTVKAKIHQTVEGLPGSEARFRRVLEEPEFEIVCSSSEQLCNQIKDQFQVDIACSSPEHIKKIGLSNLAFFDHNKKKIYVSNTELTFSIVSHEFIHADYFFRHAKAPYNATGIQDSAIPIYPVSEANIKQYQKALDKGDERINEFRALRQKINKKEKLTQAQLILVNKYEAAAKDCLIDEGFWKTVSPEFYNDQLGLGWEPGMKGFIPAYTVKVQ